MSIIIGLIIFGPLVLIVVIGFLCVKSLYKDYKIAIAEISYLKQELSKEIRAGWDCGCKKRKNGGSE